MNVCSPHEQSVVEKVVRTENGVQSDNLVEKVTEQKIKYVLPDNEVKTTDLKSKYCDSEAKKVTDPNRKIKKVMNSSNNYTIIEKVAISLAILLTLTGVILIVFFRISLGGTLCNIGLVFIIITNAIRFYINRKSKNKNNKCSGKSN